MRRICAEASGSGAVRMRAEASARDDLRLIQGALSKAGDLLDEFSFSPVSGMAHGRMVVTAAGEGR